MNKTRLKYILTEKITQQKLLSIYLVQFPQWMEHCRSIVLNTTLVCVCVWCTQVWLSVCMAKLQYPLLFIHTPIVHIKLSKLVY